GGFVISFLGGGLAGLVMGRLAIGLFRWLRGWPAAEITLTVALAYLTFFSAEHYLGVSGVVATVIAGLVVGSGGRTRMSPPTCEQLEGAWAQFGFWRSEERRVGKECGSWWTEAPWSTSIAGNE